MDNPYGPMPACTGGIAVNCRVKTAWGQGKTTACVPSACANFPDSREVRNDTPRTAGTGERTQRIH